MTESTIELLLTTEDWDFAGIKFSDNQPMLVQRKVAKVTEIDTDTLLITVPNGPHPILEKFGVFARHYVSKNSITGITFYTEEVESKIITASNLL